MCDPVVFCFPLVMLDEAEPRLRKDLPPGHYAFASLLSERSLLELERGDLPKALRLASQAVDAVEAANKAGKAGRNFLPRCINAEPRLNFRPGDPMSRQRTWPWP